MLFCSNCGSLLTKPKEASHCSECSEKIQGTEKLISTVEDGLTALQQDIESVVDYEHFLTSSERAPLEEDIDTLEEDFQAIRRKTRVSGLNDEDSERVETLQSEFQAAIDRFSGYNEAFVDQQITAHESLFTDIDGDGTDLTEEQCRAVVRNDDANQVIAGAGTGKTLTLTHRIAYLIECGVDPERIAAITLTNNATDEIEARLRTRFGITDVNVRTIHSFAGSIAQDATENHITIFKDDDKRNYIEEELRLATRETDSDLAHHYRQFLTLRDSSVPIPEYFESEQEYIAARAEQSYETIAGETVASQAEKVIGDFLFTHGVTYQYEAIADWAETAPDKRAYKPDFYLPECDCYIEHWGIDENGEVAPWFSQPSEKYREKLLWGRDQFAQSEYDLIDIYEFEEQAGRLERALAHRLQTHGISLDPMSTDELVDYVIEEYDSEQAIISNLVSFVDNAKIFNISPDEARARLPPGNPRLRHFGECGARLLESYEKHLGEEYQDYTDMIYNAIEAIESDPTGILGSHDHILVDEFQDVSIGQIRLIKRLTSGENSARLFCVGDDWQSIYAFRGAVVRYFIEFDDRFGPSTQTVLTQNYRCPAPVVEASTALIKQNSVQVSKEVEPMIASGEPPQIHTLNGSTNRRYATRVGEYTADLIEEYIAAGCNPSDIMVLARSDTKWGHTTQVKDTLEKRRIPYDGKHDTDTYRPNGTRDAGAAADSTGVSVFSAHQAKGQEANHVILLHAVASEVGFSPQIKDDELLDAVRDEPADTVAEQRRLLYVAMTRAQASLDILTRADEQSAFLSDMQEHLTWIQSVAAPGCVGDWVTLTATVDSLSDDPHPTQAQRGTLKDDSGKRGFVAWANDSPPTVREGLTYEFENLRVDRYEGDIQLQFTKYTEAKQVDS